MPFAVNAMLKSLYFPIIRGELYKTVRLFQPIGISRTDLRSQDNLDFEARKYFFGKMSEEKIKQVLFFTLSLFISLFA